MRIVLNNNDNIIDKVSELCKVCNCSPTQLILNMINNEYAQVRCKDNDKEENSDQE